MALRWDQDPGKGYEHPPWVLSLGPQLSQLSAR